MSSAESLTVLVTGALGYLGSHVCRAISQVPDLDLVSTSRSALGPSGSTPAVFGGRFLVLDPRAVPGDLAAALIGIDAVVHLAGADRSSCSLDIKAALETTAYATAVLLEASIAAGVRRFVYISSAHVYGSPLAGHITELIVPRPTHPYGIVKRTAEDFVIAARDTGRIEGVVLRLSNCVGAPVCGTKSGWDLISNDLSRQAASGECLRLHSSGEQWRDFVSVTDAAEAILHMIRIPQERLEDGLFNLGARSLRVIDLAELIAERAAMMTGHRLPVIRRAGVPEEPLDYSTEKLTRTGFRLAHHLEDEIDDTLGRCISLSGQPA